MSAFIIEKSDGQKSLIRDEKAELKDELDLTMHKLKKIKETNASITAENEMLRSQLLVNYNTGEYLLNNMTLIIVFSH